MERRQTLRPPSGGLNEPAPAGILTPVAPARPIPTIASGWPLIAAAWTVFLLGLAVLWHANGIFLVEWERTFGWGRGLIAGAFSLGGALSALATPLIGRLADRYSVHRLVIAGALTMGGGLVLIALIRAPWHLYLSYTLAYLGFTLMGHVPMGAVLARTFPRRRALAIGIAHTGMGSGGILLAPLIPLLITVMGWRWTLVLFGVVSAGILVLLGHTLFRRAASPPVARSGRTERGTSLGDALRSREFWVLALAFVSANLALSGIGAHMVPFLADRGVSLQRGVWAIALLAFSHVGGKLGLALLSERFRPHYPLAVAYGLGALAVLLLVMVGAPWTAYVSAALVGLAMSATTVFQPILGALYFGTAALGAILGVLFAITFSLASAGGAVAGLLYDTTGTYRLPFLLFLGLLLVGSLLVLVAGWRVRPATSAPAPPVSVPGHRS
ncbi:MAG: MFS transporter [Dehalococcoidia bacterium]|nr:MFS transporter [Dehalococcoidia bacterium]MDW8119936.1 MFS transporter [Chloroflexota bacterium]